MEGRLIKNHRDFPEWFKNKVYPDLHTTQDWHSQLVLRIVIKMIFISGDKYHAQAMNSSEKEYIRWVTTSPHEYLTKTLYDLPIEEFSIKDPPVDDLSIHDAVFFSQCIRNSEMPVKAKQVEKVLAEGFKILPDIINNPEKSIPKGYETKALDLLADDDVNDWFSGDAFKCWSGVNPWLGWGAARAIHGRPITVDTSLDDKTLVDSFKMWLKMVREEESRKAAKPFTSKDFDRWNRYKILQVLDIDVWSKITGNKITDSALAGFLWPDNDLDAEDISPLDRLRKVTRKTITSVISTKTLRRLAAQVEAEKANHEESGIKNS